MNPHASHSRGWMPPLDGLRGLAILMVMLFHYGLSLRSSNIPQHVVKVLSEFGWTGVDLFFVLSAVLITGICWTPRTPRIIGRLSIFAACSEFSPYTI